MNLVSYIYVLLFFANTNVFCQLESENCSPKDKETSSVARNSDYVKVLIYKVATKIRLRYSETSVTTILQNTHVSKEAYYTWKVVIPKLAFLSSFHFFYVSLDYHLVQGSIISKRKSGNKPVSLWVRNANLFSVDIKIDPLSEVQVYMAYGEILERNLGYYQQNVYLLPQILQTAKSVIVTTDIDETGEMKFIRVPFNVQDSIITRQTSNRTKVIWNPTVEQDRNSKCAVVQYVVQYDMKRQKKRGTNGLEEREEDEDYDYDNDTDGSSAKGKQTDGRQKNGNNSGTTNGQDKDYGESGPGRKRGGNRTELINGDGSAIGGNKRNGTGNTKGKIGSNNNNGLGGIRDNSTGDNSNSKKNGVINGDNKNGVLGSAAKNGGNDGKDKNSFSNRTKSGIYVNSGEVVVISNFFFHFLVPVDLKPLRKHLVFIQDISGSMAGPKLQQMKEAMMKTLGDLKPDDYFNIITFAGSVNHWTTNNNTIAATSKNISSAKDFVKSLEARGRTAIKAALEESFNLINNIDTVQSLPDNVKSLLIFMTDGLPTDSNTSEILLAAQRLNKNFSTPIHALGFGKEADMEFLKYLALQNYGLSRHIYEGSDAAEQLKSFYEEISTPVLTDVKISYDSPDFEISGLSITNFTTVFGGKEIRVAGKIVPKVPGRGPFKLIITIKGNSRRGPVVVKKVVSLLLAPNIANNITNTQNVGGSTGSNSANGQKGNAGGTGSNKRLGAGGSGSSQSSGKRKGAGNRNSGSSGSFPFGTQNRFRHLSKQGSKVGDEEYVNKIWTQLTLQQLIDSYLTSGNSSLLEEIRKLALKEGIVTPYTSMIARLSSCSQDVLLDPLPVEAIEETKCSIGNIIHPLESIRWFNKKAPTVNLNGIVYNISLSRQEIEEDTEPGAGCTIKTKMVVGTGTCQHLLDCPQSDFKDSLDVYKSSYFCGIKSKSSDPKSYAGTCCLTLD